MLVVVVEVVVVPEVVVVVCGNSSYSGNRSCGSYVDGRKAASNIK